MLKVLWISPYAIYDKVGHAGGKTQNYYMKAASDLFNVHMISCFQTEEKMNLDLEKYGISGTLMEISTEKYSRFKKKIINIESTLNPFNRHSGLLQNYTEMLIKKALRKYISEGNLSPDIIILAWTEMVLIISYIKELFPKSKIVAIEEDVAYLGYERKQQYAKNCLRKWIARCRYKNLKKRELLSLGLADKIVNTSEKDKNLLIQESVDSEKIFVWTPYFDNYSDVAYKRDNKDILFFGAMSRPENYLSAIWFIENVFYQIEDKECRFLIIGGHPPKDLLKYESDRIKVLGFVKDVRTYFSNSLCMVAPLVLGAGIKIKILESLSSGIPVLTNGIGIEGIPAADGKDYFYCQTPEEYLEKINYLLKDDVVGSKISQSSRKFIHNNYNLQKSAETFIEMLTEM